MSRGLLTLDQLIALNDEISAIARIGVPLEVGLRELGHDMPGRLGEIMRSLERDMSSGRDLATALENAPSRFPPAYQAMVLAGLQSGHLPLALECVAHSARRVAEVRRSVRIAIVYPLLVLILAYVVFVAFTVGWLPQLIQFYEEVSLSTLPMLQWLANVSRTAQWWAPAIPLTVIVPLAVWYYRSWRNDEHPLRSMRRCAQVATFSELLASMIERGVPLTRALPLAGDAVRNDRLASECRSWTDQLLRGEPMTVGTRSTLLPEWLIWLLQYGRDTSHLSHNLRQAAHAYRRDLARRARWFAHTFPLLVTVIVGGSAALAAAISILGPWFYVLYRISDP